MAERRLDRDREIALEQLPRELRPAFSALWNLDLALADVVATSSDPHLGAIRLAWWRERLEELDQGMTAPAEPRLQAIASELLPRGVRGKELSSLEDAWLPLLQPFPWDETQAAALRLRGHVLFGAGARLLGRQAADAEPAGELWSLADVATHCSDQATRTLLRDETRKVLGEITRTSASELRPLTMPAALAVADIVREGSGFARGKAAVLHRLTGRFPRS